MGSALWGGMRGPSVGSLPSPPAAGGSPHVALWGRWAGCPGCLGPAPVAVGLGRAGEGLSSSWACWCLVSWWPWWSRLSHTP